ncbi:MAG TPA: FAD-binding oxidoreductase [Phenylobacterium sp.]|jgi:D-arginine dehydrogenase
MDSFNFIIVGAGIAGLGVAAELAQRHRVLVIEREAHPAFHSTGRSAALYLESYGPPVIRQLTAASRGFFEAPPEGFAETPLLAPRGGLHIAREDQVDELESLADDLAALGMPIERLGADEARARVPILRPGYVARALGEPGAMDIDAHALQLGFQRVARRAGATLNLQAELMAADYAQGRWTVETPQGEASAPVLIDAAGAWADAVAAKAGAAPLGLRPLRRTALVVAPPEGVDPRGWPAVVDVAETFYFKPDAGRILLSPADETPSDPCDAQADELDVAIAVDRVQQAADLPVRRVERAWAGLRTFAPDRVPVVGFDANVPGFFWLAGQGGYGLQTAPALARVAAALAQGEGVPADIAAFGVADEALSPARLSAKS